MNENKILRQYKRDLELDLMRFDSYNYLMEAIIDTIDIELSILSILHASDNSELNRGDSDFNSLDLFLNPDEINRLNSYGSRKLAEIEKTFDLNSEKIIKAFDDKALNKTIHELCFQRWIYDSHKSPIPLVITKNQPPGFIQLLVETFRKGIQDYHTNFNKFFLGITPIGTMEPENPYKDIFINGWVFKFFKELEHAVFENQNKPYANYSFIFNKLLSKNYLLKIKHIQLMNFLIDYNGVDLKVNRKFSQATSKPNQVAFNRLHEQYEPRINAKNNP